MLDKTTSHTVILIDANASDAKFVEIFLKSSKKNYDVYFYEHDTYDLEWLNHIAKLADKILINNDSKVTVTSADRWGPDQEFQAPILYFKYFDDLSVDQ